MKKGTIRAFAAVGALVCAFEAAAAPLNYDEVAFGEINFNVVGTVDAGTNIVKGAWTFANGGVFDRDSFTFIVPDGMQVTDITYRWTNLVSGVTGAATNFALFRGTGQQLTEQNRVAQNQRVCIVLWESCSTASPVPLPMFPTPANGLQSVYPFGAGTYTLVHSDYQGSAVGSVYRLDVQYVWNIVVAAVAPPPAGVPEPSTFALLATGVVGLSLAARRRLRGASAS